MYIYALYTLLHESVIVMALVKLLLYCTVHTIKTEWCETTYIKQLFL